MYEKMKTDSGSSQGAKKGFFKLVSQDRILFESKRFYIAQDAYPVSKGHLIIFSKRIVENFFDLNSDEIKELNELIIISKQIVEQTLKPTGYNIGMNCFNNNNEQLN